MFDRTAVNACFWIYILINAAKDIFHFVRNENTKINMQESKERKFQEKVREREWAVLIFT